VLSKRPGAATWDAFFDLLDSIEVPPEFMADRPMNAPPQERDLFGDDD
jgi:antitoxin VapB